MNFGVYARTAARQWRELAASARDIADMYETRGKTREATFFREEAQDRDERARHWQRIADAPAWKRWFM